MVLGSIAAITSSQQNGPDVYVNDAPLSGPLFNMYKIDCEGKTFEYPDHVITEQTFAHVHPSTLRKRFLFLRRGDRIAAIMNAHEGIHRKIAKITPNAGAGEAVAVVNLEDGHAATSMAVQLIDPRAVWLVVGSICALMLALVVAMTVFMPRSDDSVRDWEFAAFGFFCLIAIWSGFCLLWELGKNGVLLLTGEASRRRVWEEAGDDSRRCGECGGVRPCTVVEVGVHAVFLVYGGGDSGCRAVFDDGFLYSIGYNKECSTENRCLPEMSRRAERSEGPRAGTVADCGRRIRQLRRLWLSGWRRQGHAKARHYPGKSALEGGKGARAMIEIGKFDVTEHLDNEEVIAEYLAAALEDQNLDMFMAALADVAKARGITQLAKDSGLGRESLYKTLSPDQSRDLRRF